MAFGSFWGSWAVVALDAKRFLRFSDAQFGLLLAATVLGGVLVNTSGGVLTERIGTRRMLAAALAVWGTLMLALAAAHSRALFCVVFLGVVAAGGLVDVAMNVAGTAALASSPSGLLRLHALFNAGALVGAATAGVLLHADVSFRAPWLGLAVVAWAIALWCWRSDLPAGEAGESHRVRDGIAALRASGLAMVALAFAFGAMVEGGIDTWGVLFLRSRLALTALVGATAYVVAQALATTARGTLGWIAEHLGDRRAAQLGLMLAGVGLLTEATVDQAVIAAVGLGIAAVGAAVYWPLLLSYATGGRDRPGVIVGGLSAAGYVGFLAGPPIVGWVADATDLRWGLAVLAAAGFAGGVLNLRASTPA
jgi:MFS family permease